MLDDSKKAGHSLIIMGVSPRPGDKLFFGDTAAAVFEKSSISIVFLRARLWRDTAPLAPS
jgi:nucleotide-binding universal stress UspA family protein